MDQSGLRIVPIPAVQVPRSETLRQNRQRHNHLSGHPTYVVVSGGTAANDFVPAFGTRCAFVLPVSDDGGSSSEILRCLGGPSIGDIRSRLIRLIPLDSSASPESPSRARTRQSIYNLFAHRFPATCTERQAKEMWLDVVEGKSVLWDGIPEDRRECIRAFFVHFNLLVLKRAHKRFSFRNFSIGNGFLSAARDMLGGLPGAVFMFKAITESQDTGDVLPVILTNQRITIAAELASGTVITGQCEISHPPPVHSTLNHTLSSLSVRSRRGPRAGDLDGSSSNSESSDASVVNYPSHRTEGVPIAVDSRRVELGSGRLLSSSVSSTTSTLSAGAPISIRLRTPGSPWRDDRPSLTSRSALRPTLPGGGSADTRPDLKRVSSGVDVNARMDGVGTIWANEGLSSASATYGEGGPAVRRQVKDTFDLNEESEAGADDRSLYVKGHAEVPLESRITRLFYINVYGQEIHPEPNTQVLANLASKEVLVYSCGSLWTSIVPCLALRGMGKGIARSRSLRAKIVLLNYKNDRETSGYDSTDYVRTIADSLNRYLNVPPPLANSSRSTVAVSARSSPAPRDGSGGEGRGRGRGKKEPYPARRYITHLVHLEGGGVPVDEAALREMGIESVMVPWSVDHDWDFESGVDEQGVGKEADGKGERRFGVRSVEWAMDKIWRGIIGEG